MVLPTITARPKPTPSTCSNRPRRPGVSLDELAAESGLEIVIQQPVEQMLSRFAPHRQPARGVRTRPQSPLHRCADGDVLSLNLLADLDTCEIAGSDLLGNVRKKEVEDDFGPVDTTGDDQVGVHRIPVAVDHEVWIDPVVEGAIASADGAGSRLDTGGDDRARLE